MNKSDHPYSSCREKGVSLPRLGKGIPLDRILFGGAFLSRLYQIRAGTLSEAFQISSRSDTFTRGESLLSEILIDGHPYRAHPRPPSVIAESDVARKRGQISSYAKRRAIIIQQSSCTKRRGIARRYRAAV